MRVLIAYGSRPPTADYLKRAFARQGITAETVNADENSLFDRLIIHPVNKWAHNLRIVPKSRNLFEDHLLCHTNYRSTRLKEAIARFRPDLLFLIRGIAFRTWAFADASMKFGWWVESDERVGEALSEIDLFDHYFFINSSSVETAKEQGHAQVSYLSHAVDASAFRPLPIMKDLDFSFVGLWSERRQRFMEAALEVTGNGAVYGPKWRKKTLHMPRLNRIVKGKYIAGEKLVELYNRTKIVINVTNWGANGGLNRSGMTMRIFEVPATRSFLLTDESQELHATVNPGEHLETFKDVDDFQEKLRRYLNDDHERERIAAQGMVHVQRHHSYDAMVDSILQTYDEVRSRKDDHSPARKRLGDLNK